MFISGIIKVDNNKKLDFERNPRLRLIVVAHANSAYGYTTVWVNLKDVNDNPPKFTQDRYVTSVWEENSRGTYVTQVKASDADEKGNDNSRVTYSIVSGNIDDAFEIAPANTGIIKTKIVLDREILDTYKLEIEAVDHGVSALTSTCTLRIQVIDVNDNAPFFPGYAPVNVPEGTELGTVIKTVTANDVDINPTLTYDFAPGGNPDSTFSIDRFSGKIAVAKQLDYEVRNRYHLKIQASDTSHVAQIDLIVNVADQNDNAPEFSEQSYQVRNRRI